MNTRESSEIRDLMADEINLVSGGEDVHIKIGPVGIDVTSAGVSLSAGNHQITFWSDGTVT